MAENPGENKNSKGIGELFVEFGTKGLPTMLKQLNTVSATFLLGKNAASQFAQTLIQPAKKAGETVTEWRKLNNELGLTYDRIQSMQAWAKKYGISDAIFGDMSNIVDVLTQFRKYGVLPQEWYEAFRLLQQAGGVNLDITQYENTAEGAIKLLNDIGISLKKINDIGLKRNILKDFGISLEALDYLKQGKISYQEMINLGQKEVNMLLEQKKAVGELEVAWDRLWMRIVAISSTKLTPFFNTVADVLTPPAAQVTPKTISTGAAIGTAQGLATAVNTQTKNASFWQSIKHPNLGIWGAFYRIGGQAVRGAFNAWREGRKGNNATTSEGLFAPEVKDLNVPSEILEPRPDLDQAGMSNLSTDGIPTDIKSNLISSATNFNLDAKIYVDGSKDPRATGQGIRQELLARAQYNNIQNKNMTFV